MKMRVLYATSKKKLQNIAEIITNDYATEKVNCMDKIPPAYSCDKERLVVILATVGKDAPNSLVLFCKELTKARAANVAFIVDGPAEGAEVLAVAVVVDRATGAKERIEAAGVPYLAALGLDDLGLEAQ